jgi:mannose/fructose/N-acetylgalactosamine-specific phosphotransferase system component IID
VVLVLGLILVGALVMLIIRIRQPASSARRDAASGHTRY